MTPEIYVLDRRVRLLQPEEGFRTSLDSVMLAAACPAREGERVLDMGCGVGGAGFCLLARVPGCHVTGVELQADHVALAERNIALNGAEGRAAFACADIRDFMPDCPPEARFDHIICNPPYLDAGAHTPSPQAKLATARGHAGAEMGVKDWVDAGFRLLESGGSLTLIHRADQADRIIQALGRRFGALALIPLWPHAEEAAKRVIIRAVKDRRSPATLHPGIVLHGADGAYTPEAEAILRDGRPIIA
jgi:tRNA1(Val) A37 N6-methylase TrmN6